MKIWLLSLLTVFILTQSFSQDVYFDWAKKLDGGSGWSAGHFIGIDASKNVYVAANYANTIDLDPGDQVFNITGAIEHFYIIKLDPSGNFIWGKNIAGSRYTICHDFEVDSEGNVYATGLFSGTTDFDPGTGTYELTATYTPGTENYDIFSLKLDTDGNFRWAARAGNLSSEAGSSITFDQQGNVFTTGSYVGVVDFDPGPGAFGLGKDGVTNTFITKFDKTGNFIWAKDFAGSFHGYGTCIETDNAGNLYISGTFEGKVDFDPGPGTHYSTSDLYSRTPYLAKLDAAGDLIWVKENEGGGAFEVNVNQQIYTNDPTAGGPGKLSKYDSNGNRLWTKTIGGRPSTYMAYSSPIRIDAASNVYLTGEFHYTEDFDPGPGVHNLTAMGGGYNYDAFITRLDANGNLVWVKQFGNYSEEHPVSLAIDTDGNVYTTGVFIWTVDFDPGAGVFELTSSLGTYIHKMSRCANVTYSSLDITACTNYTLNGITYEKEGKHIQTMINASGCDSIITLNLSLQNKITTVSVVACESYLWNNRLITASGTYSETFTSATGCDSIVHLNLTVNKKLTTTIKQVICEGSKYEGFGTSGTYTNTFVAANGCDSIRILNLVVLKKIYTTITRELCEGQSYDRYTSSGIYIDTFISSGGCDSIRTLNLKVNPVYAFTISKKICQGETYMNHRTAGTYIDTLHTISGCDSIQTTVLTVQQPPNLGLGADTSICIGDSLVLFASNAESYRWQDGSVKDRYKVKSAGLYSVVATNGCGSASDNIYVGEKACTIYFPTAFTPDGDGNNDKFGMLNGYNVADYHMTIYNRYGEIVFESKNPAIKWDGKYRTQLQSSDVFIWQCVFKENNTRRAQKGTVLLIR